jgi:cytochrome P450
MTISRAAEVDDLFRPLDSAFIVDPYPALNRLREAHPVYQNDKGTWVLSRYDDITRVTRSPQARRTGLDGFARHCAALTRRTA